MSFFNDEQKITKHFLDSWDDVANPYRLIPVDCVSEKKDPIEGKLVRFRIKRAPSTSRGIGNLRRNFGAAVIQIVVPFGSGAGAMTKMADVVCSMFKEDDGRPLRLGNIKFRTASGGGPFEEEKTSLVTMWVEVPFSSDYSS
jgi:hypothetical protein